MSTVTTPTQREISNPTAKARFMSSGLAISLHRKMVDSDEYQKGVDFSKLEYHAQLAMKVTSMEAASVVGIKLQAVDEFLQTFRLLGENPPKLVSNKVQDHLPEGN